MLESVFSALEYAMVCAAALMAFKFAYSTYFFVIRKNEITILTASISNYKLRLKSKIRQRLGAYESYGTSDLKTALSETIDELLGLEFNEGTDYQKLILGIAQITQTYTIDNFIKGTEFIKKTTADSIIAPEFTATKKALEAVFEFDKDISIFTVEIRKLTEELLTKIEQYNNFAKHESRYKKITDLPSRIEIPTFFILEELCKKHLEELSVLRSLKRQSDSDAA
jgi:hypothetical protein